ncbi:MAG: DUF2914 domain-containing protein [Gemmatimonadota bacterium]|nr:DUF2914 domain-containing protein [Gemmatimonadota bacterium]
MTAPWSMSVAGGLERPLVAALIAAAVVCAPLRAQDPEPGGVDVTTAVVATGVEDREPVGEAQTFPADVGELYFYTVLEGAFDEREVEHVWERNGEETARVSLTVRGPHWRTWSAKTIPADWTGEWEVRVEDQDGTVLRRVSFQVGG